MARLETRLFLREHNPDKYESQLLIIPESADESMIIDLALGDCVKDGDDGVLSIGGSVQLSDGYGEHYIRLINPTRQWYYPQGSEQMRPEKRS